MPIISIDAPEEKLERIFHFLDEMDVMYHEGEHCEKPHLSQKERLIRLYGNKKPRPGLWREALELRQAFRDDFEF
jgi:hypothetical protein